MASFRSLQHEPNSAGSTLRGGRLIQYILHQVKVPDWFNRSALIVAIRVKQSGDSHRVERALDSMVGAAGVVSANACTLLAATK